MTATRTPLNKKFKKKILALRVRHKSLFITLPWSAERQQQILSIVKNVNLGC